MSNAPVFFSVVIPLYNKEATIERAIKSVLNQTVQDYEIVVINDGSTDKGPDVVSKINDQRIRLIKQSNQGVSAARNRGIDEAKYDLIAFLDADDEWYPKFLETILRLRNKFPASDVFGTGYVYQQSDSISYKTIIRGLPSEQSEGVIDDYFMICAYSDPLLCSSSICVSIRAIKKIGGFPIGIKSGEDIITWSKLACAYKIAYSNEALAMFWMPINQEADPRHPEMPDVVGYDLETLALSIPAKNRKSIYKYISLWHRMRANAYIRLGMRQAVIYELMQIFKFDKSSFIIWVYLTLLCLPSSFVKKIYRRAKSKRRIHVGD